MLSGNPFLPCLPCLGASTDLSFSKQYSYKIEQEAAGSCNAQIARADGKGKAITARGNAEAFVIEKYVFFCRARQDPVNFHDKFLTVKTLYQFRMGEAEASAMTLRANAWKEYTSGAYLEMIINRLPQMAHEVRLDSLSEIEGKQELTPQKNKNININRSPSRCRRPRRSRSSPQAARTLAPLV